MEDLTDKQRAFVEHYILCLNGAEAARRAGYPATSARQIASENLSKPDIRAAIDKRMEAFAASKSEVLALLTEHARSTMADFFTVRGRSLTLDLKKAHQADKLHLVKKYSKTKQGITIEMYDAQAALGLLGKHYGLFIDRTEHSGEIAILKGYTTEASPDAWNEPEPAE